MCGMNLSGLSRTAKQLKRYAITRTCRNNHNGSAEGNMKLFWRTVPLSLPVRMLITCQDIRCLIQQWIHSTGSQYLLTLCVLKSLETVYHQHDAERDVAGRRWNNSNPACLRHLMFFWRSEDDLTESSSAQNRHYDVAAGIQNSPQAKLLHFRTALRPEKG